LDSLAYKNALRVCAMIPMRSWGCASCWEQGPIWLGIVVWFGLIAFMLFGVSLCLRARKSVKTYADDEENVVSLQIEPQFITPWV
jgi:hypothetical protein